MMDSSKHPVARSSQAIRLREHTLVDVEAALGADSFSLVDDDVTFTRQARAGQPRRRWNAKLGNWLVSDGLGYWRIVSDLDVMTAEVAQLAEAPGLRPPSEEPQTAGQLFRPE